MKIDTTHLLSAIEDYIAKADEDLRDTLESEGFVAASETVRHLESLELCKNEIFRRMSK